VIDKIAVWHDQVLQRTAGKELSMTHAIGVWAPTGPSAPENLNAALSG
jgi:hypothetical protein